MKIEKMKRWVIAMLLCGVCHTAAFAYGYAPNAQSKNWGYQPVYQSTATTSYVSAAPTYQFRSTSMYITSSGESESDNPLLGSGRSRRTSPWDWGEEDDPIGEVPDPLPVGDSPWCLMLLLAAAYIAFRRLRQRKA